jgi:hypothetical protein
VLAALAIALAGSGCESSKKKDEFSEPLVVPSKQKKPSPSKHSSAGESSARRFCGAFLWQGCANLVA